jgi:hypothetical protein
MIKCLSVTTQIMPNSQQMNPDIRSKLRILKHVSNNVFSYVDRHMVPCCLQTDCCLELYISVKQNLTLKQLS